MSSEAIGAIADRYSAALFELAEQGAALDSVAADLKALKAMVADSDDLRRLLKNPVISRAAQAACVTALADKAGWTPLTRNFLALAARNRRLFAVVGIINAFLARLAAKRGDVTATVAAAQPLTPAQIDAVTAGLQRVVGRHVSLDVTVDPSLLGGLVVKVGSRMVDSSLKTKLQQLTLALKGVG